MRGPQVAVLVLVIAAAVGAWWFTRPAPTDAPDPTTELDTPTTDSDTAPEAALRGAGREGSSVADAQDAVSRLAAQAGTGDASAQHEAFRQLKALYAAGEVPLERLVAWALGLEGAGNLELVEWARTELAGRKPVSLELIPQILEHALGAPKRRQDAAAELIRALGEIRAQDVPLVGKLFEHEKTEYWLQSELIDAMDGLGPAVLPLAPHLMDWIAEVLRDRQKAAREALEAGIHVSWDHVEYDVEQLLGNMGDEAVPILVERLHASLAKSDEDEAGMVISWEPDGLYADALAKTGERGVRTLIAMLDTVEPDDRSTIVNALAWLDGPNETLRSLFLRLLREGDAWTRAESAEALAKHGRKSIPALLEALNDTDAGVRKAAAQSLKRLKVGAADALEPLRAILAGDDRRAALEAAETIAGFGADGASALPQMIEHLEDDDFWGWDHFARAVGRLGAYAPGVLTATYASASPVVQRGLITAARSMPATQETLRLFETALRSPDARTRVLAAEVLIGRGHKQALAPLLAGFDAEDDFVRILATLGLAKGGAGAAHLLPRMLERVAREDLARAPAHMPGEMSEDTALDSAIQALGRTDFTRMFALIDHETFDVYYAARQAFEAAGAEGLAWLVEHWDEADAERRIAILDIARSAWFRRRDDPERWEVAKSLARRGLVDPSLTVRSKAIDVVEDDPTMVPEMLPVMLGLLRDGLLDTARGIAYELSSLGAKAAPIESELRALQKHPDETIRLYVLRTLDAITDAKQNDKNK